MIGWLKELCNTIHGTLFDGPEPWWKIDWKSGMDKYVGRIEYSLMTFVWISNHYDHHLEGLCMFHGKLHRFETADVAEPDPDELPRVDPESDEADEWWERWYKNHPLKCDIFKLGWIEKLAWKLHKWLFEVCVGTHWTYPDRLNSFKENYGNHSKLIHYRFSDWYFGKNGTGNWLIRIVRFVVRVSK